jgi:hypothetical protein
LGRQINQSLNREGVAYILHNTVGLMEQDEYYHYSNLAKTQIKDLNRAEYHIEPVLQMYTKGLMRGYPNGYFGFEKTVTRAETVATLYRLLDKTKRIPYQQDVSTMPRQSSGKAF